MKALLRIVRGQVAGTAGWAAFAAAISVATGILTARSLGPEQRGTLALVVAIAGLCVLVGAFGTNVAIRRHLPQKQSVNRRGYVRTSRILLVPLSIILPSALYVAVSSVDQSFGRWPVGLAFIVYGLAYYFSNQALDLLNALGLVRVSAKVNALGSFVCLVLVAVCAISQLGLEFMIWAYALSVLLQALVATLVIRRQEPDSIPGVMGTRVLVRDGGRLLGLNLGQHLAYQSDTILLGALSGPQQVGNYAVAITPAAILRIPANALGQVLFHEIASGTVDARTVLRKIAGLLAVLIPCAAFGWMIADWMLPAVFGSGYTDAVWPFRFLLVAEILLTPFLVLGRALAGDGRTWSASACGVVGVVVLVAACLWLVPSLGAVGAALASVLAYASMSGLALYLFMRGRASRAPSGGLHDPARPYIRSNK